MSTSVTLRYRAGKGVRDGWDLQLCSHKAVLWLHRTCETKSLQQRGEKNTPLSQHLLQGAPAARHRETWCMKISQRSHPCSSGQDKGSPDLLCWASSLCFHVHFSDSLLSMWVPDTLSSDTTHPFSSPINLAFAFSSRAGGYLQSKLLHDHCGSIPRLCACTKEAHCGRPSRQTSSLFLGFNQAQTWQDGPRHKQEQNCWCLETCEVKQEGYGFAVLNAGIIIIHKSFLSHLNLSSGQALSSSLSCSHTIRKPNWCHAEPLSLHCPWWTTAGVWWAVLSHLKMIPANYFMATQK